MSGNWTMYFPAIPLKKPPQTLSQQHQPTPIPLHKFPISPIPTPPTMIDEGNKPKTCISIQELHKLCESHVNKTQFPGFSNTEELILLDENHMLARFPIHQDVMIILKELILVMTTNSSILTDFLIQCDFRKHVASDIAIDQRFLPCSLTKTQRFNEGIFLWTQQNQTRLNIDKSEYVHTRMKKDFANRFTLDNELIERQKCTKILAVWVGEDPGIRTQPRFWCNFVSQLIHCQE